MMMTSGVRNENEKTIPLMMRLGFTRTNTDDDDHNDDDDYLFSETNLQRIIYEYALILDKWGSTIKSLEVLILFIISASFLL